jgi:hypothetical protein
VRFATCTRSDASRSLICCVSPIRPIDRLAAVVASRRENMRIEGHTDNVPIHNYHFSSNWELSVSRAAELVKLFIYRYNFALPRLSAAGYAELHPVVDNNSTDGRARNRRVDIVILNPTSFRVDSTTVKFAPSHLFFPSFCAKNGLFSKTTSRPLIA